MRRALLSLLALALILGGCGDDRPGGSPRPGVGTSLDADNLAVVHDELYACLREALPDALLANYLGGQASITNSLARSSFDERLADPEGERALLDAGRAEFIGVRANRSLPGWRRVPEWDLLILPATLRRRAGGRHARRRGPRTGSSCAWSSARAAATRPARPKPR